MWRRRKLATLPHCVMAICEGLHHTPEPLSAIRIPLIYSINRIELPFSSYFHLNLNLRALLLARDRSPCTQDLPMCSPPKTSVLLSGHFHEFPMKHQGLLWSIVMSSTVPNKHPSMTLAVAWHQAAAIPMYVECDVDSRSFLSTSCLSEMWMSYHCLSWKAT